VGKGISLIWRAPIGETPAVEDSGDRFTLKLISVTPRGDMRFSFIEGRMNSDRYIEFLRKLRKDAGRPIIVIADNASYHKSKKVMALGESSNEDGGAGIHVAMLPTYCPELNPDEQVWNHAKRRLGKLFVVTKDEMKTACFQDDPCCKGRLLSGLNSIGGPPRFRS
jgi:transposase